MSVDSIGLCRLHLPKSDFQQKWPTPRHDWLHKVRGFMLVATMERQCAQAHLKKLGCGDVVVYDRGYFSYEMLYDHHQGGIDAIFRLQDNSAKVIQDFIASSETDIVASYYPSKETRREILKKHPEINFIPILIRLVKYTVEENFPCCLEK
jgi:hypothetical protein